VGSLRTSTGSEPLAFAECRPVNTSGDEAASGSFACASSMPPAASERQLGTAAHHVVDSRERQAEIIDFLVEASRRRDPASLLAAATGSSFTAHARMGARAAGDCRIATGSLRRCCRRKLSPSGAPSSCAASRPERPELFPLTTLPQSACSAAWSFPSRDQQADTRLEADGSGCAPPFQARKPGTSA